MFKKIINLLRKKEESPEVEQPQVEQIINNVISRLSKNNNSAVDSITSPKAIQNIETDKDYLNKNCTNLTTFVISPEMTSLDLKKLCELNSIDLQISSGWHSMLINLLVELDIAGWDRSVQCIKEKYARLAFYADSKYTKIIEEYEYISEKTCETCGKKGNIRYNSTWDYVACRKHYLEKRNIIKSTLDGFELNGKLYLWKNVLSAVFEDYFTKPNDCLTLTFNTSVKVYPGFKSNKLSIFRDTIGYGEFLKTVPLHFNSVDYTYLNGYSISTACEICGYVAVYNYTCECCENDKWISEKQNFWDREEYIKFYQGQWIEDEGPEYSDLYKNYSVDDFYKIIYRPEEAD